MSTHCDVNIKREHQAKRSKRLEWNDEGDGLNLRDHVRMRRVSVCIVDGERLTKGELRKALRAAKRCGCGDCYDCDIARAAKRAGY